MVLFVPYRFRGPAASGNGGYVAGLLASTLDHDGAPTTPVTVTLRRPPPLEVPLEVVRGDGQSTAQDLDGTMIAEAQPGSGDAPRQVPAVSLDVALAASETYPGRHHHPFPQCFVCGPDRAAGDGMRLFPGRIDDGSTACVWHVDPDLAGQTAFVWAALDCPGGWAAPIEDRPMVLGRITAQVSALPEAGEDCVITGRLVGSEGRKVWTATTAYGADERELGRAFATWITL
ncbi:hypothetical protein [Rhodococcus tibetensis]|uniref:Thioesterase family protein n=1 Tax=Rhodococcus tibetensis TaxID=2965064 RepID=A0ABT1Q953_9NOCA|nr:hypothetical protein [Rhodococcus sp. FXJ9.536]MCQ4118781.1 hypothetical protein [Rhodococcus sp. FXJ9.536]